MTSDMERNAAPREGQGRRMEGASAGQSMWGGRFAAKPSELMDAINASIDTDRRMAAEDLAGSRAHADMLREMELISAEDHADIQRGLALIREEIESGAFPFRVELEDIHMNVEARLRELVGEAAGRLHTARSRNDQVVTGFRLWTRRALADAGAALAAVQAALVRRAGEHAGSVMPGFTHLQIAQPVTLGHHLLAYAEMLERDRGRFSDAARRLNESPLGAAALAGTPFPIDRDATAEALGFDRPMANSLDAVSSRDFAVEALSALTMALVHLSRLAEEMVLWTSPALGFARLPDEWSTGSSIMPQKRNPDAAELVRAKAAGAAGRFTALSMAVKALPLAYAKDLQDDKALVFAGFDEFFLCARAMEGMTDTLVFDTEAMRAMAGKGYSTATDLADWLVRVAGRPFREAHHITGRIVAEAERQGLTLDALSLEAMQAVDPAIDASIFEVLSPERSVASRTSYGGTAPGNVAEQARQWRLRLGMEISR